MHNKFSDMNIYGHSVVAYEGTRYFIGRQEQSGQKWLGVTGDAQGFSDSEEEGGVVFCPLTPQNGAEIRSRLPWLNPVPLGRETSFGFGDRLGSATPGHIEAMRTAAGENNSIAPIFAQQSVRENSRTGRTPQQVMDDAMWGVLQEGWRHPWGADADHVKDIDDLPPFVKAGYTFYTIDPSDHVDNDASSDGFETLASKAARIPWDSLGTSYEDLLDTYCRAPLQLEGVDLEFDEEVLLRALVKYGRAIIHTATVAAALDCQMAGQGYDLEMSVDETDTPTSIQEHYFIANELLRLGVPVVSLAPRFVGKFQKGVDYMGDLAEFEAELAKHVAILHHFAAYKLSVHTGSDKFSIYGTINKHAHGYVHVKTAGTSYLEALRVIAYKEPDLFRPMLDLSRLRFEHDRKTYYIDAKLEQVPTSADLSDGDLPDLFEQFDARQVMHVTFGSILDDFGEALQEFIANHEADYRSGLETHFARHLDPFCD